MATKAGSKAAAARAEKTKGKAKTKKLTWKGIKLELPAEFPEKVMTQFQVDRVLAEDGDPSLPYFRLLKTMIGNEQLVQVRSVLETEKDVSDLLEALFDKYGMGLGESGASQDS
jgi:hypothetical protein